MSAEGDNFVENVARAVEMNVSTKRLNSIKMFEGKDVDYLNSNHLDKWDNLNRKYHCVYQKISLVLLSNLNTLSPGHINLMPVDVLQYYIITVLVVEIIRWKVFNSNKMWPKEQFLDNRYPKIVYFSHDFSMNNRMNCFRMCNSIWDHTVTF